MSIRDELIALKNSDGLLVVEEAHRWAKAHPESDLHAAIEWDEPHAAHQWQLWQIRRLVAIHVISDSGERKFVSLSIDRTREGGGYRDLDEVLPDRSLREVLLEDALEELGRVQARYKSVQELAKVWEEAEAARATRRRRKAPAEAPQIAAG